MNNETQSIHSFEFELICDFFSQIDRQGPGSVEITKRALQFIEHLPKGAKAADLGCGTGGQTITLAQNTDAQITAIDLFPKFIDLLNEKSKEMDLTQQITTHVGSMDELPFQEEELDLIWSEGAIYNIGFERGINEWRKYLKTDGYIAVSEVSWFTKSRPAEIEDFWMDAYPEINTISAKVKQMEEAGYTPVATFTLPEYCWLDEFYAPMVGSIPYFLEKYKDNAAAKELVRNQQHEMNLYCKYKKYYGYVFYIGQKK